jgi:hypothetical protein
VRGIAFGLILFGVAMGALFAVIYAVTVTGRQYLAAQPGAAAGPGCSSGSPVPFVSIGQPTTRSGTRKR